MTMQINEQDMELVRTALTHYMKRPLHPNVKRRATTLVTQIKLAEAGVEA